MNGRRRVITALGVGLVTLPFALCAQPASKVWRVGFLSARSRSTAPTSDSIPFLDAMRELGYVEGKNLRIEWCFAEGSYERLAQFADELVKLKVDVIVAAASPAIKAAQRATATIPIVFPNTGDPVGSGFVASLARPGG